MGLAPLFQFDRQERGAWHPIHLVGAREGIRGDLDSNQLDAVKGPGELETKV